MWREANGLGKGERPHDTIPGVTVQDFSDLPEGAVVIDN